MDRSVGFDFAATYTRVLQHERIEASFGYIEEKLAMMIMKVGCTGWVHGVTFNRSGFMSLEEHT